MLIDTNFNNISDYEEVFETQITAKVWVLTDTNDYKLYLKNDRTTTTTGMGSDVNFTFFFVLIVATGNSKSR